MRATKVKGALACPVCAETIDPEEHSVPEEMSVWVCPECEAVSDDQTFLDQKFCSHEPPEVVCEKCPECEEWVDPQGYVERKQCPLCEEWIDPEDMDFDETEVYKCGECGEIYGDRDEAKECCRD